MHLKRLRVLKYASNVVCRSNGVIRLELLPANVADQIARNYSWVYWDATFHISFILFTKLLRGSGVSVRT